MRWKLRKKILSCRKGGFGKRVGFGIKSGSYTWSIPVAQVAGNDYRIRITSTSNSACTDTSENNFIISAAGELVALFIHNGSEESNKVSNTSDYGYSTLKTMLEEGLGFS
ncbi:hypothetical protein IT084_09750 [Desulfallas sp. Bu1-1]|uniref:hypothetical protein n=1 Tax=Desulfallas sp. Bu1-1 TaxID=2787620 RepID=UPI00189F1C0F|nr:hypothetical protein [Desulfallas sp. Bu1-1]MBF7083257.1 hypothetical protein [Desulfallas sp. Bu1-1]